MEIANMLLLDFTQYLDKFASIQPPTKERLLNSEVKNEESNFYCNIKLFSDVSVYLKGCFEVYLILIKQLDDMIFPYKRYLKLVQFLARGRLNVSNLIFTAKNTQKNISFDEENVNKHLDILKNINSSDKEKEIISEEIIQPKQIKYPGIPKLINKETVKHSDLSDKIRQQFTYKSNEDNKKILRLNNILNM